MKTIEAIFIFLLATLVFISCGTEKTTLFVSPFGDNDNAGTKEMPFKTIEKALLIAETLKESNTETVVINLLEGDYHLSAPLVITDRLSNLSIVGNGVDKVSIKGSKKIAANWKTHDKNIWVTKIKEDIDFNQLFINGEKQILARYPNFDTNGGIWNGNAQDAIAKERVAKWKNPIGGFVHALHKGRWGGFHYEITGVDLNGDVILIGGHQNNRPSPMHPKFRMVENVFEELDSDKEWYYDIEEKNLYLWVSSEVNLNTALVEVSTLNHLVEINGTKENPVKNVKIEGMRFEHAKRTFMEEYHQLLRSDWTIYRGGAILLNGTENCTISDCEFTNLGGNVIFVNGYNRNTEIIGNHIYNCGASAISFVGDSSAIRSPSYQYHEFVPFEEMDSIPGPANDLYPAECRVENNLIYNIGNIEKQVAGVQISMAMKIHVKNNSIYNVPRAGINVSEGTWGGHLIENNDVFNTVLETSDHGSFNSWGRDRFWHPTWKVIDTLVHANPQMPYWDAVYTTVIRNNRFRCDHGWDIDLDDGSSNYHVYNNLCLNGGIKLREGFYRVVKNNIMVNNGFHPHAWFDNSEDIFKNNIITTKHFPFRVAAWGKEIDFNFFPDSVSLDLAQSNNTDKNSLYGNPMFTNPTTGDYSVKENSRAVKIGFKNFPMNNFGVQKTKLKAIAEQPDIPKLRIASQEIIKNNYKWLGGTLKNIESLAEQSASGLHSMNGVIISKVAEKSKLAKAGITQGDVIVEINSSKIKNIADFISTYNINIVHGRLKLTIVRNQKNMEIRMKL